MSTHIFTFLTPLTGTLTKINPTKNLYQWLKPSLQKKIPIKKEKRKENTLKQKFNIMDLVVLFVILYNMMHTIA